LLLIYIIASSDAFKSKKKRLTLRSNFLINSIQNTFNIYVLNKILLIYIVASYDAFKKKLKIKLLSRIKFFTKFETKHCSHLFVELFSETKYC